RPQGPARGRGEVRGEAVGRDHRLCGAARDATPPVTPSAPRGQARRQDPMTGEQRGVAVTLAVLGLCYAAVLIAVFRYVAARTPAGIVRRLFRTGQPVTVAVNFLNLDSWDPSHPPGRTG